MTYKWLYNNQNEVGRYLFTAADISKGIFGKNLFYVLPFLPKTNAHKSVYFPELGNGLSPQQWEFLSQNDVVVPVEHLEIPRYDNIVREVTNEGGLSEEIREKLKSEWLGIAPTFEKVLEKIFLPDQIDFSVINIYPTKYGCIGSYFYEKNTGILSLYVRSDVGMADIAHLIVLGVLLKNSSSIEYSYTDLDHYTSKYFDKTLVVADFLFLSTKLAKLFPNYISSGSFGIKEGSAELAEKSVAYLEKMGFKTIGTLELRKEGVYDTLDKKFIKNLTPQETKVLALMLGKVGKLCTYEDIAEELWGSNFADKFSLYHLNKLMHQLRFKLKVNGYHSLSVETKRGLGYMLYFL